MDLTAQTAPRVSEIINETASTGDAWIRQRKDPCRLRNHQQKLSRCRIKNHQRNCFHGLGMDSTAQTAPPTSEIITENASTGDACIRQRKQPLRLQKSSTKLLPRVTHVFDSANSPCGLRNHQRNCFHWCRMDLTAQTALGLQKSSTKLLLGVTHTFDRANSPCGLRNLQRN